MLYQTSIMKDRRFQLAIGLIVAITVSALAWWGYQLYRASVNERAQLVFAAHLAEFEKASSSNAAAQADWATVARGFEAAGSEHSSSDLAPFFTAFAADAWAHAGEASVAQERLAQAVTGMGRSNPFYYVYSIKLAVISGNEAQLRDLAQDRDNPHQALAWYHIWHQAFVAGNQEAATAAFSKLAGFGASGAQWAQLAQAQIECVA